ncbi:MAG: tetratricopeptide repeat protein [Crocinitomicaceae bacterium]
MIHGEDIGQLITDPKSIEKNQINAIHQLIEKYPYCSSLYIIHLIGLAKTSAVDFEQQLKIAAIHVSDREHLFFLINPDIQKEDQFFETIASESVIKIEEESEPQTTKNSEVESVKESSSTDEKAVISSSNKKSTESDTEQIDPLEKDFLSQAAASRFDSELSESATKHEKSTTEDIENEISPQLTEESSADDTRDTSELTDAETEQLPKIDESDTVEAIKEIQRPSNMTFIEWLKYKQELARKKNQEAAITKEEDETDISSTSSENRALSKQDINDLLDKFIEEEPSIGRTKKEFFSPTQSAKKSLEDSDNLVSETLAKIHLMQGNYSKAITAYQQLSLLYPEKKAFFASQIEKIKEKQSHEL